MFKDTDDNPYRASALYDGDDQPLNATPVEPDGVWRWRHLMIFRRSEPVFPQACVLSNVTDNIKQFPITAMSPSAERLMLLSLQVPGIGWLLVGIIMSTLKRTGDSYECHLPFRRWIIILMVLLFCVFMMMALGGNILSAYGLFTGNYLILFVGMALSLLVIAIDKMVDPHFLRTRVVTPEYIVIDGVHAAYLDRLPEFPDPTNNNIFTLV
ncbi:MAG: hypothetical protein JXM70_11345 [Pirellulales bacterium]|nr:hypothetical protein [Pirellulales bacterium]